MLKGEWQTAETVLSELLSPAEPNFAAVKRRMATVHFQELLDEGDRLAALKLLRTQISPYPASPKTPTSPETSSAVATRNNVDKDRSAHEALVSRLSLLLFAPNASKKAITRRSAQQSNTAAERRKALLVELTPLFPADLVVPENRLDTLLKQAVQYQVYLFQTLYLYIQISQCLYHNTNTVPQSLLNDCQCDKADFPNTTSNVFEDHQDEVWYVSFSHSGSLLASGSKDKLAIIWDVEVYLLLSTLTRTAQTGTKKHELQGHSDPISLCKFSPDDSILLTASNDKTLRTWSVQYGSLLHAFSRHSDLVSSCAWLPCGQRFLSGSVDKVSMCILRA